MSSRNAPPLATSPVTPRVLMHGGVPQKSPEERELDALLREEARKRDYGDGIPRWSVYYCNRGTRGTGPPAISRAAQESLRPRSTVKGELSHHYCIAHSNLVSRSASDLISRPHDEAPRISPTEAAAISLIQACDVDGDGMLDLFEIIKTLMHRPHLLLPLGLGAGSTELQILEVIKKADEDNSAGTGRGRSTMRRPGGRG
jgi:hypothetical protein